jgi:hypothetical protein
MRNKAFLVVGVVVIAAAVLIGPARPANKALGETLILPPNAARTLALGRDAAAADIAWLFFVQLVGSAVAEQEGYPQLENWLALINDLAPRFDIPYYVGSVLLATTAGRADEASAALQRGQMNLEPEWCRRDLCPSPRVYREIRDELLERCQPCEALEPCEQDLELFQGFVEYFGRGDSAAASKHFCEARRRGGAAFLSRLAARAASQATACHALARDLRALTQGSAQGSAKGLLRAGERELIERCVQGEIKRASASFRLARSRDPKDMAELIDGGFLKERPIAPRGMCWELKQKKAVLEACEP